MDATWDQWTWFIASWLFHCSWMVLAAGFVFAVGTLCLRNRNASLRYRWSVCCLGLVSVCIPTASMMAYQLQPASVKPIASVVSATNDDPRAAASSSSVDGLKSKALPVSKAAVSDVGIASETIAADPSGLPSTHPLGVASEHPGDLLWVGNWVAIGYFTGLLVMLLRIQLAGMTCWRLISNARVADEPVLEIARRAANRLGIRQLPAIKISQHVVVPFMTGILQPTVLLPASLITGLSASELQAVVLHELVHFRRHDHWILLLQRSVETFLFFHPVVWVISRSTERHREMSCDDQVLDVGVSNVTYAESLLQVAAFSAMRAPKTVVAAAGSRPSFLKQRIERIIDDSPADTFNDFAPRPVSGRPLVFMMAFAAMMLCAAFTVYGASTGTDEKTQEKTNETVSETGRNTDMESTTAIQEDEASFVETFPEIVGVVRDEQGNPLTGVSVIMQEHVSHAPGNSHWILGRKWTLEKRLTVLAKTTSDQNGKFRFSNVPVPSHHSYVDNVWPVTIVAIHNDYAFAWNHIKNKPAKPLELKLDSPSAIEVDVNSEQDGSITGLTATLIGCMDPADWKRCSYTVNPGRGINNGLRTYENLNGPIKVHVKGSQVTISQMPPAMVAVVQIVSDGHVPKICYVSGLSHEDRAELEKKNRFSGNYPFNQGNAKRRVPVVSPARVVVSPTVDVTLNLNTTEEASLGNATITTVTGEQLGTSDSEGTVVLNDVSPVESLSVIVRPSLESRLQAKQIELKPEEVESGKPIAVALVAGRLFSGSVVNKDTKQGAAKAVVSFVPKMTSDSNAHLKTQTNDVGVFQMIIPRENGVASVEQATGFNTGQNARSLISGDDKPVEVVFQLQKYRPRSNQVCRFHFVNEQQAPAIGAKVRFFKISKSGSSSRLDSRRVDSSGYLDIPASELFGYDREFVMVVENERQKTGTIYRFIRPASIQTWDDSETHIRKLASGIPEDAPVMSAKVVLKQFLKIEGTVVDQKTMQPIPGARVSLRQYISHAKTGQRNHGPSFYANTTTDTAGKYSLNGFVATPKTVSVSANDYNSTRQGEGISIEANEDASLRHLLVHQNTAGGRKSLVEVLADHKQVRTRRLSVKVMDYESGEPVAGVKFELVASVNGDQYPPSIATTDQDGNIDLTDVPAVGDLKWRAQCDGYHSFGWRPIWENTKSVELLSESNYDRLSKIGELLLPDVTGLTDLQAFRRLARSFERTKSRSRSPSGDDPMTHSISAMKQHPVSLYRSSIEKVAFASDGTVDPNAQFKALRWCLANDSIWPRSMRSKNKEKIIARLAGFSNHPEIDSVFNNMRSMKESESFFQEVIKTHPSRSVRGQAVYQLSLLPHNPGMPSLVPGFVESKSSATIESKIASQNRRRDYLEQVLREFADVKQGNSTLGESAKRNLADLDQFGIGGVPTNFWIFTTRKQRLHLHDLRGRYTLIHYWYGRDEYPEALLPWTQDNDQVQLVTVVHGTQEKVAELTADWRSPVVVDVPSSPGIFIGSSRKTLAAWAKMSGSTLIDPEGKIVFTGLPKGELYRFLKKNELLTK